MAGFLLNLKHSMERWLGPAALSVSNPWTILKAAVGPLLLCAGLVLFACSDDNSWTAEERVNAHGVLIAMASVTAATRISNQSGGGTINRIDLITITASLRTALNHAQSVEDKVLDKIHPHLRTHWRNELEQGLEMRLKNLEGKEGNLTAEIEGAAKLERFGFWWNTNKAEIRIPKLK